MVKARFFILVLTLNILNSLCQNVLESEESIVELGIFQNILFQYEKYYAKQTSCWAIVTNKMFNTEPFIENYSCDGTLVTCAWPGATNVCASTIGSHKIQWVTAQRNGKSYTYGTYDSCPKEKALTIYQADFYHSICQCYCFHSNWGVHVGQLRSRESENRVIIGIRFILHDNVLYLQPAEGKLGANRTISGFSWIPLPKDPSGIHRIDLASRHFFMDDLILDEGYAVTGIRLQYMEALYPNVVRGFGISVSGRPFFDSGDLNLKPGRVLTINPRPTTERYLESDMPNLTDTLRKPLSKLSLETHEYVELKMSTLEADFSQSTLPFFRNPTVNDHQVLLSGFGIFHETLPSKERFITLRFHAPP